MPKRTASFRKWKWIPASKTVEHDPVTRRRQVMQTAEVSGVAPNEWNRTARRCYAAYTKKMARAQARRAK